MKKLQYYFTAAGIVMALLAGCKPKDDKVIAPVTNENDVPNGVFKTNFLLSIHVIPSSQGSTRTSGLDGASVTVSQNAKVQTKIVGKDGEAVFENLVAGDYTLFVSKDGYASWNGIGNLQIPDDLLHTVPNDGVHDFTISAAELVYLPVLKGAVTGVVNFDDDLNSSTPLVGASGLTARLQYDENIQPNVYVVTVGADGKFAFVDVPNAQAVLSIDGSKNVGGKIVKYATSSSQLTPRILGTATNVGTLIAAADQATLLDKSGTFKFWPRGNFDFTSPAGAADIEIEEVLPAEVTLDFSNSITDPLEQKIYTGTKNSLGIWTFENLPTGKNFQIKFSHVVQVPVDRNSYLVRKTGFIYTNNTTSGSVILGEISTNPDIVFNKVVTFDGLLEGNTYSVDKNQTKDIGIQIVVE